MKRIITLPAILLFSFSGFAQNKTCTNETLSIHLNTESSVKHQVNKVYLPVQAEAVSIVYPSNQVSLTKISDVNPYMIGTYEDCYTATDGGGLTVKCCRIVVVSDTNKIIDPASVVKYNSLQVLVYPNPVAANHFYLQWNQSSSHEVISMTLYDVGGREVLSKSIEAKSNSTQEVSLEGLGLDKGIYIIKLTQDLASLNKMLFINQ